MASRNKIFHLQEEVLADGLRLYCAAGSARAARSALLVAVVILILAFGAFHFPDDRPGLLFIAVSAAALGFLWERYELRATITEHQLHLKLSPAVLGWLAPETVDLRGVSHVRAHQFLPALLLYRGRDWELVLIPANHLSTGGRSPAQRVAEYVSSFLAEPEGPESPEPPERVAG